MIALFTSEFPPYPGGIATYCHEVAAALQSLGHQPVVHAPQTDGTIEFPVEYKINRSRPSRYHHLKLPAMALSSYMILRGRPADLVIAADLPNVLALSQLNVRSSKIAIVHGTDVKSKIVQYLNRYTPFRPFLSFDQIYSNSAFTKRLMLEHNSSVLEKNVQVAPLGVSNFWREEVRPEDRNFIEEKFSLPPNSVILLSVGRIEPRKGISQAVKAITRLPHESRERLTYLIVGKTIDFNYADKLRREISLAGADIRLIGEIPRKALRALYHRAHLLLHTATADPFRAEGFGLVLVEAAACGLPTIGTCVDALPEVIQDGDTGMLLRDGDIDGIADAIRMCLHDPALVERLKKKSLASSQSYTWENHVQFLIRGVAC